MQKVLKRNYLKDNLSKIIISLVICFMVLCGFTSLNYAYASSSKVKLPISINLVPNYDEGVFSGVFSVTLTPTSIPGTGKTNEPLNIFAIPGRKTIDEIPVIDYQVDNLPAPCFKLVDTGISAEKFWNDNKSVTYNFNSSVFTKGEEYTIFAYYQFEDAECIHYFSELYYYTYLVPVPLPPDPVKEGYTFVGWYYDEDFTQPYIEGTPIYEDTQLYAKFEINKYTVTFNLNGGELVSGDLIQTVEYGNSAVAPVVTREGYNFVGWDKQFDNITGDITITAQWEIKTYTVTFYVDGVLYDTIVVEHGTWFFENPSVQKIMQTLSAIYTDKEKTTLMTNMVLSDDAELYVDVKSSLRDWLDFALWFQKYWIWLAVGVGVLAFVIIAVVIKVKRG